MFKLKVVLGSIIFLGAICVRGEVVHVYEQMVVGGVTNRLSDTTKETGGDYVTQSAPSIAGFIFTGWTTDAKQPFDSRDALGRSFDAVSYHLYELMTLTANYLDESIDSDGDGIADGYEFYWYGDLSKDAASDTDGDGYGFAAELAAGTNPLMKDRTIIGGVVYEDSDELLYNPHGYAPLTIRSEPEGALFATTVEYLVPGADKAGPACDSRETIFAYWMTNGVPVRDALGRAVDSVTFVMPASAVELVAVCVDDEADRQKLYWYGTTEVASDSDTDGDGYTLAVELAAGTNPLMKDRTIIGGVVYEDSEELEYNPNRYRKCVIRSEPEGSLFDSITSTVRAGDPITTPNCAGQDGFACWRVDGVDVRDALGRAVDSVSILMPNHDAELVAVCVENEEERTKLYWYGTTDVAFDSDTDGDGYTFAQELAAGTNPLMKDRTIIGGVVFEDGDEIEVDFHPVVCESENLSADAKILIRKALSEAGIVLDDVKRIAVSGPTGNVALIADMGIAPAFGEVDETGTLKLTYAQPTLKITSFDAATGAVRFKVTPGEGNKIVSEVATGYIHVYGTNNLGEPMEYISQVDFDLTPYLKSDTQGEGVLNISLGTHTFLKVKIENSVKSEGRHE